MLRAELYLEAVSVVRGTEPGKYRLQRLLAESLEWPPHFLPLEACHTQECSVTIQREFHDKAVELSGGYSEYTVD